MIFFHSLFKKKSHFNTHSKKEEDDDKYIKKEKNEKRVRVEWEMEK